MEKRHFVEYACLLLGLAVVSVLFVLLRYTPSYQFYCVIAGVVYYFLWGLVHHLLDDRLSLQIVGEYALLGTIVILLFALVLGI